MSGVSRYYILNDTKVPVECNDFDEWARWMDDRNNYIVDETPKNDCNGVFVYTTFLGVPGMWFATGVFNSPLSIKRFYNTWEEAEKGHKEVVMLVERWLGIKLD